MKSEPSHGVRRDEARAFSLDHLTPDQATGRRGRAVATLALALSTIGLSPVVHGQVSGTINENAPVVSTTLHLDHGWRLDLEYTAIRYGKGRWRMLPGREAQHAEFNAAAPKHPIGTIATNCHVIAAENMIPPGRYDLYFTVTGHGWEIHLGRQDDPGAPPISWHMHPDSTRALHKRLRFSAEPGVEPDTATFGFAFGQHVLTIPLELRSAKYPYGRPPGTEDEPDEVTDEQRVRELVARFFDVIASKDVTVARDLVLPEGLAHSVRTADGERILGTFTFAQWLERLPTAEEAMREAFLGRPRILIDGDVAVVFGRYEFDRGGERSHTGVDAFTVVRTDDGWRLAGALYSIVR